MDDLINTFQIEEQLLEINRNLMKTNDVLEKLVNVVEAIYKHNVI